MKSRFCFNAIYERCLRTNPVLLLSKIMVGFLYTVISRGRPEKVPTMKQFAHGLPLRWYVPKHCHAAYEAAGADLAYDYGPQLCQRINGALQDAARMNRRLVLLSDDCSELFCIRFRTSTWQTKQGTPTSLKTTVQCISKCMTKLNAQRCLVQDGLVRLFTCCGLIFAVWSAFGFFGVVGLRFGSVFKALGLIQSSYCSCLGCEIPVHFGCHCMRFGLVQSGCCLK